MLLALFTLAAIAGAIALWLLIFPTPRFAQPTGPFGIGTRLYEWTDATRLEPFTVGNNDHRRLVVQIWYPSFTSGPKQPYIDHAEVLTAIARRLHIPRFLLRNLRNASTHSVRNGRPELGPYPVLINPSGFLGFRAANLFWIEDLASHGYVVVTLDQPGTAAASVWTDGKVVPVIADKEIFDRCMPLALSNAPDQMTEMNGVTLPGGIIPFLAADLSFVLDQLQQMDASDSALAGVLDLDEVGVFGMSLGGYIAPEACYRDRRFKACLAVDAGKSEIVAREGLDQPLMVISRDADVMREERSKAGGWPESEIEYTVSSQSALFEHNRGDAYYVTMNRMYHVNWTDAPLWSPLLKWMGLAGPIDPYLGFAITNDYTRSFFDRYLKRHQATRRLSESRSEVRLDVRMSGEVSR